MHADEELEQWQQQWRAQPAVPLDLRRRVERDLRGRRLGMLASIAVTVIMGGGTSVWAVRSGEPNALVLAYGVWIFIAVAWALRLQLERERGPRPHAETTVAFLDYAIRSRRVRLQAITASVILYMVLSVFILVWRYRAGSTAADPWAYLTSSRVVAWHVITVVLAVRAAIQRRRFERELKNLVKMRDALERSEAGQ